MLHSYYIKSLLWAVGLFSLISLHSCTESEKDDRSVTNEWKVIGPGGGGGVMKPTISPHDDAIVMVHCDMTAAYLSHDGGANWTMKNLWNVPEDFEFDPVNSNIIYTATKGFRYDQDRGSGISFLYKSTDKGQTWEIVYPDISKAKSEIERVQSYDYLPSEIIEGAIDGTIEKIAVDPVNNNQLYIGLTPLKLYIGSSGDLDSRDSIMLLRSEDQGRTWEMIASIPGNSVKAIFPPGDTGEEHNIVVFTDEICAHVNETSGQTSLSPLPVQPVIAVEGGRNDEVTLIYLQSAFNDSENSVEGGMYVSVNLGHSWKQINTGLQNRVAEGRVPGFRRGLAVCETLPQVAYISVISPEKNEDGGIDPIFSIYKTINAGTSWDPVLRSSTPGGYLTQNFEGAWMEESYDPGWGGAPIDLGVAPSNPDICFAGDNGRGYKTTDGGKTWKQTYSQKMEDGSYANRGLNVTTCYGVHFDPFDENHLFICYTDMGLFHTFNGGKSWFHALQNIPRAWQNTCYDLTFDPEVKGRIWSVWANAHDLPRTKMFGPRGFDHYQGGVAVSLDNGITWGKSNNGLPENAVCTNILLDPTSPADARILYISVFDTGVYKSTDGGKSWHEMNNGIGHNKFAWQVRMNSENRLFVLLTRGMKNRSEIDGAVYFSDDGAESWKPVQLPEGVNGPHDLLVDESNPQRLYLSCWPVYDGKGDAYGGVYKTEDGGNSWMQVFDERVRVNSAAIDPENPNKVFINTFQNAAYFSTNSGEDWNRIEGYRFKWGQRPIPDKNNPGKIFLTTYGGSVYYGPEKGTPGTKDDILNMPENWW